MSREIKFRAKLVKGERNRAKGQWVYGLPQQRVEIHGVVNLNKPAEIGYIVSYEPERMLQSGAPDNNLYWYEIDPETLGQFTSLKDAKGQDIYEGDILGLDDPTDHSRAVVVFHEGAFRPELVQHPGFYDNDWDWTIIGNIYETPELLSEGRP